MNEHNTQQPSLNESQPLSERERWEREWGFKERELKLKEREYALNLQDKQHAGSGWRSPLVVAIMAASIAAAGNAIVALTVGIFERQAEQVKAEQALILEMIKTGDKKAAAVNLAFLVNVGLVSDRIQKEKLADLLSNTEEDQVPVLPGKLGVRETASISYQKAEIKIGERAVRVQLRETNNDPRTFSGNPAKFTVNGKVVPYADEGTYETVLSLAPSPQDILIEGQSLIGDYVDISITEFDYSQQEVGEKTFKKDIKDGKVSFQYRTNELSIEKIVEEKASLQKGSSK